MSTRRGLLLAAPSALALATLPAIARAQVQRASLPHPTSLAAEAAAAASGGRALVVMVSLEHCAWCKLVRDAHLAPLRAAGQPVVQIELDRPLPVGGFDRQRSTHAALARAWGVRVAPTVLFFGRDGREVAPRIAGMPLPDFYGAYLDERLQAANRSAA